MFDMLRRVSNRNNLIKSFVFLILWAALLNAASTLFFIRTGVGVLDLGGGANLIDNRVDGYSPAKAYQLMRECGREGRRYYLLLLAGDLVLPAAFALFCAIATLYFLPCKESRCRLDGWLLLFPGLYLSADYLENLGIAWMLIRFPAELSTLASATNKLRAAKFFLSGASLLIVFTLASSDALSRIFRRGKR